MRIKKWMKRLSVLILILLTGACCTSIGSAQLSMSMTGSGTVSVKYHPDEGNPEDLEEELWFGTDVPNDATDTVSAGDATGTVSAGDAADDKASTNNATEETAE